jgi:bifunctional non-homologous end joining protein LigD
MKPQKRQVSVYGRPVLLSNLDKVLYPATGFTKGHVIDYYARASHYLLPHIRHRPITLKRFPDGVLGNFFYEKNAPRFTPDWVDIFPVKRRSREASIRYILVNDLPTLVWISNLANLEIHPFLHRAPKLEKPTAIVFDLDPGEGADILNCRHIALLLRDLLGRLGLESFVKVSGSKGIQVYVPFNTTLTYQTTTPFARALSEILQNRYPGLVAANMSKHLRAAKVLIDWSQNSKHKTTVSVYSLRAKRPEPFVSVPLEWNELEALLRAKELQPFHFTPERALDRLNRLGDLFQPVLTLKQSLPDEIPHFSRFSPNPPASVRSARRSRRRGMGASKQSRPKGRSRRSKRR